MAPTKATNKRAAPETKKAAPPKKTKAVVTETIVTKDPVTSAIEATIEQAALPHTCKNMLVTGIRGCLDTPSADRHELQAMMVGMVDEVINEREALLVAALEAAKAAEGEVGKVKAELAAKLGEAESVLAEKVKIVDDKTQANASAVDKVSAAKALLVEKEEAQRQGDSVTLQLQEDKAAVEKGIDSDAKEIKFKSVDGTELLATLERLKCDESLIKALPATCARAPAERGAFDGMVLSQLDTSLAAKLEEIVKSIEGEQPGVKDRSESVSVAQQEVETATALQATSAEEQAVAEACQAEASAVVESAQAALAAHAPVEADAAAVREQKTVELDNFQSNTKAPFVAVRDKQSKVTIEESTPDAKVAPMEEASDATVAVGGA